MPEFATPILYLTVFFNLILALIILSRGFRNSINILFGLISFAVGMWSVSIIGFYEPSFPLKISWVYITHLFAIIIAFLFLFFSLYFPNKIFKSKFQYIIVSVPFWIGLFLLFVTKSVVSPIDNLVYTLEEGYLLYQLIVLFYFISGFVVLYLQYRKSNYRIKNQIIYILISSMISSTLALVTDLIFPYLGIFEYTWLGPIFTIVLVVSIFIAILKFKLFDIKVIVTELFVITIIIILFQRLFYTTTVNELLINIGILVSIAVFSYFLIKGVYKEVKTREKMEKLASKLEIANEDLKELSRQKSEFISLASHQFRSPLAAIKGYASLMLDGTYGEISEKMQKPIKNIFESTNGLTLIVEDFLNVSRIEQGRMKYEFEIEDIGILVKEVIESLKPTIDKSGLSLEFQYDSNEKYNSKVDIGKIKQVITNLIDNSIKYTPKGSIKVKIERLQNDHEKIQVSISDTGVGIPKEALPELFGQFKRAKNANRVNVSGTGLGLYVAKKIVEAHKGKIWAESDGEGKGASFFVEINSV